MKILITGAAGFVGRNLTCFLENIRNGNDKTHPQIHIEDIYLFDKDSDSTLLDMYCEKADFVFHFAGVNRPQDTAEFMQGNRDALADLLDKLQKHHNTCPIVLSSSLQATLSGRFKGSIYGESKKAGEQLAFAHMQKTGANVYVYRFPNLFGKWCRPQYNSAIATFCHNIANDMEITVNDPTVEMQLVYIDDLMEEMARALCGTPTKNGDFCAVPVQHTTTLGFIADTIRSFPQLRAENAVPYFGDSLVSKLYSTYLSYLPSDKWAYDLKMNQDTRGSFTEIIRTPDRGQFSVNISRPGITKGNHWHHSKNEKFLVVKGDGLIQMRKVGLDENGEQYPIIEFRVSGEKLRVVEMIPGYTHNIINLSETEDMVTFMWANECFDPTKPDTFFEAVE